MIRIPSVLAIGAFWLAVAPPAILQSGFISDMPTLNEKAASAGIDRSYTGGWDFTADGGVASVDCNGDRRPGGTSPTGFM